MSQSAVSLLRPRPTGLLPFVLASVVAHALLVGGMMLFSWLFEGPKVDLGSKPITASLVRLGKKRDEKLLPRKEEEPPPAPPPAEKPVEVKPPPPPEKAIAIPTKDAEPEKKKDTTPSKDDKKDTKKDLFAAFNKSGRAAKAEELEGEETGDVNGDSAKQEGERYYGILTGAVRRYYDVSSTIDEAERRRLKAVVSLRLGTNGELLEVEVRQSSGNELFDSAVVGAVKKAAPFGPPPSHLRDELKKSGVDIVFTP